MTFASGLYRSVASATVGLRIPHLWLRDHPRELRERLGDAPATPGAVWLHAASVGELGAAAPLLAALREDPARVVALSVMTRTGRAQADELGLEPSAFHPPLDAPAPVRRALDRLRPSAWIALETEVWPTLLAELSARGISAAIASARLSVRGLGRMKRASALYRPVLQGLAAVAARTDDDAARFLELGVAAAAVRVTGDLKEDRPVPERTDPPPEARWMAACTRPGEEADVLEALRVVKERVPRGELLIAPRHPERFEEVAALLAASGQRFRRWSSGGTPPPVPASDWSLVLVDVMGVLDEAYRASKCAFVGGSLRPFRGHSPWEAATAGRPVMMGPDTTNCASAFERLQRAGAAERVSTPRELGERVSHWLTDAAAADRAGRTAHRVVCEAAGATRVTIDFLKERGVLR
ncbi:MAG: 3-deoxy-D-manno-octulosonic acid transferase [Gemmatimonadota bacterium]|nr:MAG: 3-deoxy-D-manno-octulosonic acid transferase [Gemmatimonadota bacterium]